MSESRPGAGTGLRITAVDTILVEGNCCFVLIRTNEGITGLGEGSISDNKGKMVATPSPSVSDEMTRKNSTRLPRNL